MLCSLHSWFPHPNPISLHFSSEKGQASNGREAAMVSKVAGRSCASSHMKARGGNAAGGNSHSLAAHTSLGIMPLPHTLHSQSSPHTLHLQSSPCLITSITVIPLPHKRHKESCPSLSHFTCSHPSASHSSFAVILLPHTLHIIWHQSQTQPLIPLLEEHNKKSKPNNCNVHRA